MFKIYAIEIYYDESYSNQIIKKRFFTKRGLIKWVTSFTKADTSGRFYLDLFVGRQWVDSVIISDDEHAIKW